MADSKFHHSFTENKRTNFRQPNVTFVLSILDFSVYHIKSHNYTYVFFGKCTCLLAMRCCLKRRKQLFIGAIIHAHYFYGGF